MISNPAIVKKLIDLQVISAEQGESFGEADIVRAVDGLHQALVIVQKNNETLMAENQDFKAKVKEQQTSEAKKVIDLACSQGKISSQDAETVSFWTNQYVQNPTLTKKVLENLPTNPVLKKIVDVKAGDTPSAQRGNIADMIQAQHIAVREVQAANPALSYSDAFNKAKREHPEIFVAEA